MPEIRTLDQESRIVLEKQLVNQQAVMPKTDLMGNKVAVRRVIESQLSIMWRGT
jgi:hypothetical protein